MRRIRQPPAKKRQWKIIKVSQLKQTYATMEEEENFQSILEIRANAVQEQVQTLQIEKENLEHANQADRKCVANSKSWLDSKSWLSGSLFVVVGFDSLSLV